MPRLKGSKNKVEKKESVDSVGSVKVSICGHEEIAHPADCKVCHEGKRFCGLRWNRCGSHGEHVESDCGKMCMA